MLLVLSWLALPSITVNLGALTNFPVLIVLIHVNAPSDVKNTVHVAAQIDRSQPDHFRSARRSKRIKPGEDQ
jgi:hypothetical protein